jgi:hypothetical protein
MIFSSILGIKRNSLEITMKKMPRRNMIRKMKSKDITSDITETIIINNMISISPFKKIPIA